MEGLIEVGAGFGFLGSTRIQTLSKRNQSSVMKRLCGSNGNLILRGVSQSARSTVEQQCHIANKVAFDAFVKPLLHANGSFTVCVDGIAWMAYREKEGDLFTGRICPVEKVIGVVMSFQNALRDFERQNPADSLASIPVTKHRPECWSDFFRSFCGHSALTKTAFLRRSLDGISADLLERDGDFVESCADDLATLPVSKRSLTHNDLQHANVLELDAGPFFLDIEDVCFEQREVALSHAIFKLLRHTVYVGTHTADHVREVILPLVLRRLESSEFAIADRQELFRYGAYRILSDIWEISDCLLSGNDDSQLYDLDKRIQNLFELHHLLKAPNGSATTQ